MIIPPHMPIHVQVESVPVRPLLLSTLSQLEIAPLQIKDLVETLDLTHDPTAPKADCPATLHTAATAAALHTGILRDSGRQELSRPCLLQTLHLRRGYN